MFLFELKSLFKSRLTSSWFTLQYVSIWTNALSLSDIPFVVFTLQYVSIWTVLAIWLVILVPVFTLQYVSIWTG